MTNRTAAIRYARALLEVSIKEKGDLRQVEQALAWFVGLFKQHATLEKMLLNPAVPVPRKRAVVAELTDRAGTMPVLAKLLLLLAERDRLILLPDLLAAYRDRLLEHQQIIRAVVTTTAPLPADRAKAIERSLGRAIGMAVTLETKVDPSIIGGVIARIGSTVYDASVTRQLERMKQKLGENV